MRVLRTGLLGVGAAAALLVSATVAVGQAPSPPVYPECTNKKPSPQDIEGAKGAHKAASQFYDRGEYDKAIRLWNDAYTFDCTANDLLLNIANAYEKLGDKASTVAVLELYIHRTAPNPNLELRINHLKAAAATAPTTAPTTGPAPTTTGPVATGAPTTIPTAPPADGPRPYGVKPWFLVGGGGLLAVVGIVLLPIGSGAIATAAQTCTLPNHGCPPGTGQSVIDSGNKGRAEVSAGWALLGLGAAAAGGGLVWQFVFNKPTGAAAPPAPGQPGRSGLWVSPTAGPGAGGVSLGGAF